MALATNTTIPDRPPLEPGSQKPRPLVARPIKSDRIFKGGITTGGILVLLIMVAVGLFLSYEASDALKKAGFRKSWDGALQFWNPSKSGTQSLSALEEGADAFARVIKERLGLEKVYAGSRMD